MVSGNNIKTCLFAEKNGQVFCHRVTLQDERNSLQNDRNVCFFDFAPFHNNFQPNGFLGIKKNGGLCFNRIADTVKIKHPKHIEQYGESFKIELANELPMYVKQTQERMIKITTYDCDPKCIVAWTKFKDPLQLADPNLMSNIPRDLKERDKIALLDPETLIELDSMTFQPNLKITNLKTFNLEDGRGRWKQTIAITYIIHKTDSFFSGWSLYYVFNEGGNAKMHLYSENEDQSANEVITEIFSVDGILFVCIENRILQYDQSTGQETKRRYDPILSYITSTGVDKDNILLGNIQNEIMYLSFRKDSKKLKQLADYPLGNNFIMCIDFLTKGNPRFLCSDDRGLLHVISAFIHGDSKNDTGKKIGLQKISHLQMSSPITSFSELTNYCCSASGGRMCSSLNGGITAISSMYTRDFESVIELHKAMEEELPFFAGLNSLNYFSTDIGETICIDKLYRHFFLDFAMFSMYPTLSIPLQRKLAQKIGSTRKRVIEDLTKMMGYYN